MALLLAQIEGFLYIPAFNFIFPDKPGQFGSNFSFSERRFDSVI